MGMYTSDMLVDWLGEAVVAYHPGSVTPHCGGGIKLLGSGEEGPLRHDCLYLAEPGALAVALRAGRLSRDGVMVITAAGEGELPGPLPAHLVLIRTRLPLLELYNRVQEQVHRFLAWDAELQEVIYANSGLQKLLQRAATALHATLLLTNAGYKHIASVVCAGIRDPVADELEENGYHSFDTIQTIRQETPLRRGQNNEFVTYVSQLSHNYTIIRVIRYQDNLAARLCVILDGPEPSACAFDLSAVLADYIEKYMFSDQGADYGGNTAFGSLAADLIECRLTDPEELEQRLRLTKLAVRRYYHLMVVSFDTVPDRSIIPWNYAISQLQRVFPFSNITAYHGDILLIIRKMSRSSRPAFERERLLQILNQYNAYAAIGNASEYLTSMPPVYHQSKEALRLGRRMDPEERIFFYEEYSMYHIIALAAESARQSIGSRNLVHLCNNEMVALVLHDKQSGGNLVEVLHTYLLHERNATETAKTLYIHRNTMLYKIRKIEEIIGSSLDDPALRERLLFSYRVLEYINRYCKEDLLTLKRIRSEDRPPNAVR